MTSMLSRVTRGRVVRPYCLLVYGVDGVGKTSLAADAPNPIFLGPENGSDELDVSRFKPNSWFEVQSFIHELLLEPHSYKTLVIDSLDWLEPILHQNLCERYKVKSIELAAGGYGKGYKMVMKDWQDFKDSLESLRNKRGMNLILLGHSETVRISDPQLQVDYMRNQLKLHSAASAFWREYVDAVFFATYKTYAEEKDDGAKVKALGGEERILYTERRPGWDAKNRFGMPFTIELRWSTIVREIEKSREESAESMKSDIDALKERLADDKELIALVTDTVEKAGQDKKRLREILNRLKGRVESLPNAVA